MNRTFPSLTHHFLSTLGILKWKLRNFAIQITQINFQLSNKDFLLFSFFLPNENIQSIINFNVLLNRLVFIFIFLRINGNVEVKILFEEGIKRVFHYSWIILLISPLKRCKYIRNCYSLRQDEVVNAVKVYFEIRSIDI